MSAKQTVASTMDSGEKNKAVGPMLGEVLLAEIDGLESMLASLGSRLASLKETVKATQDDRSEESRLLQEENQRLLARNEYLEAELRKQKRDVAANQSSTEHQVSLSQQKPSCPQLPPILGGINDEALFWYGESEASAAPTNTSKDQGNESLNPKSSLEQDPSRKELEIKKQCKKKCSADGCTNIAKKGGVCVRHGAEMKHKLCSRDGCTNLAKKGGVCRRHGAKGKECSSEGCTNQAQRGGVCLRHGAQVKRCSIEGCTSFAQRRGGLCRRHGAYRNIRDESTAFGSEFDKTTASCKLPPLLGGTYDEAEDDDPEESAAPTNTSSEQGKELLISSPQSKCTSKRKRESLLEQDPSRKEVVNKKQYKKKCSSEGCTNKAYRGGVCIRHGAKKKRCSIEGCPNGVIAGGLCIRHGAEIKRCSSEGCANNSQQGGVCKRHGADIKRKLCSSEGCTNQAKRRGVCRRHGAYRNTQDESTAFGSEFDMTSNAQVQTIQRDYGDLPRGLEIRSVPGEVTILCQQVAEV